MMPRERVERMRVDVSKTDDSREGEFEDANNKLSEGLKSCRTVLSNYRALLDSERKQDAACDEPPEGAADDNEPGD